MLDRVIETLNRTVDSTIANMSSSPWKPPITKVVSASRPEFADLQKIVSKTHLLPRDVLPDAKSVICYFIPFEEGIEKSNTDGERASNEWAQAYILTNALISNIGSEIEKLMNTNGFAVGKIPATHNFDEVTLVSDWSHRHVAYIAGLGTFGINNMFITEQGCCGRLGSIVTNYEFEYPPPAKLEEKCLFKRDGSCGICRQKCIIGAFDDGDFDRASCYRVCLDNAHYHEDMGVADVCGKCCVGLPCSLVDPTID